MVGLAQLKRQGSRNPRAFILGKADRVPSYSITIDVKIVETWGTSEEHGAACSRAFTRLAQLRPRASWLHAACRRCYASQPYVTVAAHKMSQKHRRVCSGERCGLRAGRVIRMLHESRRMRLVHTGGSVGIVSLRKSARVGLAACRMHSRCHGHGEYIAVIASTLHVQQG